MRSKAKAPAKVTVSVELQRVKSNSVTIQLTGVSPLYMHRLSEKAKRALLVGEKRKTQTEKSFLKHDPVEEFKSALYRIPGRHPKTEIFMPATALKGAICTAALETELIAKTQVQRLVTVTGQFIPIFGIPKLKLDVVRQAGVTRTPDIRSRPYFETWATEATIEFISPQLKHADIMALIENAGQICGIGDYRQEKGRGDYGRFCASKAIAPDLMNLKAQRESIEDPLPADDDTADLLAFWMTEKAKDKPAAEELS